MVYSTPMNTFTILTQGHSDIINITEHVEQIVAERGTREGVIHLFVPSTTAALTIMEDEAGAKKDLHDALDRLVPAAGEYAHNAKWGDMNGYAHVRSALMKPFLAIPLHEGKMQLGSWQSIVLIDFDNQPRTRQVHVMISSAV